MKNPILRGNLLFFHAALHLVHGPRYDLECPRRINGKFNFLAKLSKSEKKSVIFSFKSRRRPIRTQHELGDVTLLSGSLNGREVSVVYSLVAGCGLFIGFNLRSRGAVD